MVDEVDVNNTLTCVLYGRSAGKHDFEELLINLNSRI